jgi:hypothetical protein
LRVLFNKAADQFPRPHIEVARHNFLELFRLLVESLGDLLAPELHQLLCLPVLSSELVDDLEPIEGEVGFGKLRVVLGLSSEDLG